MIVMERKPEFKTHSGYEADLQVERTDILFRDVAGDRVRVQITVRNAGEQRSRPTVMRLESAPLGAFVPWQPLTQLLVPALEPGESIDLSTEVSRPRPAALGNFDRVPPKRLITAVNSPDQSPRPNTRGAALLNLFRRRSSLDTSARGLAGKSSLAADLSDLLGRGQTHWAGNINVFVGGKSVERHLARALRIYPGRTNMAFFMVGGPGNRDAFAFKLVGLNPDWTAALHEVTNRRSLVVKPSDKPIDETEWVESRGGLMVILAARPPAHCRAGNVEVHVTRRADLETAIVEFNLDPAAQGTGCYSV